MGTSAVRIQVERLLNAKVQLTAATGHPNTTLPWRSLRRRGRRPRTPGGGGGAPASLRSLVESRRVSLSPRAVDDGVDPFGRSLGRSARSSRGLGLRISPASTITSDQVRQEATGCGSRRDFRNAKRDHGSSDLGMQSCSQRRSELGTLLPWGGIIWRRPPLGKPSPGEHHPLWRRNAGGGDAARVRTSRSSGQTTPAPLVHNRSRPPE